MLLMKKGLVVISIVHFILVFKCHCFLLGKELHFFLDLMDLSK